jgi:ubiquitin-conjugating enzyme E2 variant
MSKVKVGRGEAARRAALGRSEGFSSDAEATGAIRVRHRSVEIAALGAAGAFAGAMIWDLFRAAGSAAALPLFGAILLAHPVADLVSGCIHWAADRLLSEETPYFGPHFVHPFREHHAAPRAITCHDFVETNGNTCILLVPAMAASWWWLKSLPMHPLVLFGQGFVVGLAFWLCLTNQIHSWAHAQAPPAAVRWLQRRRLILQPAHHAAHHVPPYERRFCITSGWCDPILDASGVFRRLERWLRADVRKTVASPGAK